MKYSNDHFEGEWIIKILRTIDVSRRFNPDVALLISRYLESIYKEFTALAFCLSKRGDLLSQWRGYADDGFGFSIGFSENALEGLSLHNNVQLCSVEYFDNDHIDSDCLDRIGKYINKAVRWFSNTNITHYLPPDAILEYLDSANNTGIPEIDKYEEEMIEIFSELSNAVFMFKSSAFSEEEEIRLLEPLYLNSNIKYRSKTNVIIPYKEIDIKFVNRFIDEVIIGPKNITSCDVISDFLWEFSDKKYKPVKVRKSSASYR